MATAGMPLCKTWSKTRVPPPVCFPAPSLLTRPRFTRRCRGVIAEKLSPIEYVRAIPSISSGGASLERSSIQNETASSRGTLNRRPFPAEKRSAEVPWSIPMNIAVSFGVLLNISYRSSWVPCSPCTGHAWGFIPREEKWRRASSKRRTRSTPAAHGMKTEETVPPAATIRSYIILVEPSISPVRNASDWV